MLLSRIIFLVQRPDNICWIGLFETNLLFLGLSVRNINGGVDLLHPGSKNTGKYTKDTQKIHKRYTGDTGRCRKIHKRYIKVQEDTEKIQCRYKKDTAKIHKEERERNTTYGGLFQYQRGLRRLGQIHVLMNFVARSKYLR